MTRTEIVKEAKSMVAWYGCFDDNMTAIREIVKGDAQETEIMAECRAQADRVLTFLGI